jgi:hypothetical protein
MERSDQPKCRRDGWQLSLLISGANCLLIAAVVLTLLVLLWYRPHVLNERAAGVGGWAVVIVLGVVMPTCAIPVATVGLLRKHAWRQNALATIIGVAILGLTTWILLGGWQYQGPMCFDF